MKKIIYGSILLAFLGFTLISSCSKETLSSQPKNSEKIEIQALQGGPYWKVKFSAGHKSDECHGQGMCFYLFSGGGPGGVYYQHVPCQAAGSECQWELGWSISPPNLDEISDYILSIENYHDEQFLMPSRSIFVPEYNLYMNIPEQIVINTGDSNEFLFKELSFLPSPSY